MKLIVVIDDSAFHRRVAGWELSTRSGVFIPQEARDVDAINGDDVGLLIVDRHMVAAWRQAAERLVSRLRPECEVVEWTGGTRFDDRERWRNAAAEVCKLDSAGTLVKVVNRWIKTGTVRETQQVTE
tara:strand:+ start:228 stop:608 length:381 start_codon:yes stop_codon:yes gene_type:complete